jgi:hypothetical protein
MAAEDDKKQKGDSESEEEQKPGMDDTQGEKAKESQVPPQPKDSTAASDEPATSPGSKKRKQSVDLVAMGGSPLQQGSKNRQHMKELQAERHRIKKQQKETSKKIRLEEQRQKRLVDKASRLSNDELLEVFSQRRENQEVFRASAKAKAKGKKEAEAKGK